MKRVKFFLRKSLIEQQLDAEMRFHLESVVQEKLAAGLSPDEARRQALLEFGGTEQMKEECREMHRLPSSKPQWVISNPRFASFVARRGFRSQ